MTEIIEHQGFSHQHHSRFILNFLFRAKIYSFVLKCFFKGGPTISFPENNT
jgi:hypothetical protein